LIFSSIDICEVELKLILIKTENRKTNITIFTNGSILIP
jgi:hypothetical protein